VHHLILTTLAQTAPAAGAQAPAGGCAGGGIGQLIPLLLMFVIFYFMLIRPQQKKAKDHQSFLAGLKKGEQVVTRGGVVGKITGVTDTMVTLEVQEKVRLRVLKSYVEGVHKEPGGPVATAAEKVKKEEPATPPAAT
jgi:preprotein translocase subunit YajC